MKVSPIYHATVDELRKGPEYTRIVDHQGGTASGKTVNILGALATLAMDDTTGVTTITGPSFPHLKAGALRDFEMYVYPSFQYAIKSYHKTDHLFTFKSGHVLEFKVFENEMLARGPKRKRLFVNEANKMPWDIFFQLNSRSEQSVIDYNPSIRFWAHERVKGEEGTKSFISDHRHNPFLSAQKHREIESYYDFKTGKGSLEVFKVYARGLTGNVTGLVFPNWEMIDDDLYSKNEDFFWGIDFGYTNDPTCIIKAYRIGKTIFLKEIFYEVGASASQIAQVLIANGYSKSCEHVYCEHDPQMIRELHRWGIRAKNALKGQGSIQNGILLCNQFDIKYTSSSRNMKREQGLYVYEEDKVTGKHTNVPVDRNNHSFDAARYAIYSKYFREGK